jgi:hypothetical protein
LLCHAVVDLRAVHAQSAVAVEHQSIEAHRAACGEWLRVELLRVTVYPHFHLAGIAEKRSLPLFVLPVSETGLRTRAIPCSW